MAKRLGSALAGTQRHETRPAIHPSLETTVPSEHLASGMCLNAQRRQGKRTFDEISSASNVPLPPSKRRKPGPSPRYPPEFWDAISKVPLTRGALHELDRRTAQRDHIPDARPGHRRLLRSDSRRLRDLARKGGLDLSTVRGFANLPTTLLHTMSQSGSQSQKRSRGSRSGKSGSTSKTNNTSPYDPAFEQMMIDQGVYPTRYRAADGSRPPKPDNISEIRNRLGQPRSSLSPSNFSDTAFDDFQDVNEQADSESRVMVNVVPIIAGSKDRSYNTAGDIPFNNMKKFHPNVTTPKPDLYYGASPSQINSRVQDDIGQYIVPSTNRSRPVAPNIFLAGKAKSGNPDVAQRQAMYDGAVGARGMHTLQNYGNAVPVYDNNAYTISSTYHPGTGTLQMYATHPAPPSSRAGETQYHTTQLNGYYMLGTPDGFRAGASAYRNAREWAREQRNCLIASANAVVQRRSTETRSFGEDKDTRVSSDHEEESPGSETSADELALDYGSSAKRRRGNQVSS